MVDVIGILWSKPVAVANKKGVQEIDIFADILCVWSLALLVDHGDVLAEGVEGRDDHLRGRAQDVEHALPVLFHEHRSLVHFGFITL